MPGRAARCFVLEEFVRLTWAGRAGTEPARLVARAAESRARWPPTAPEADDVADPDGLPEEAVRRCAARIDHAVRRLAAALTDAAGTVGTVG